MLILTRKKDYYDGVAGSTGIDKTIVYEREEKELTNKEVPMFFVHGSHSWQKNRDSAFINFRYHNLKKEFQKKYPLMNYFIIGFCGKLYVGWKLYYEIPQGFSIPNKLITEITFDESYITSMIDDKSGWRGKFSDNLNEIKNYDALDIFRKYHTPIFVFDSDYDVTYISNNGKYRNMNSKFFINPTLNKYEFYKIFDSFQAFQEIQMFMSGVLGSNEKNIVEVEDKYKITQYGFDKWSFRKEPSKK
jgi:hypothetical protein